MLSVFFRYTFLGLVKSFFKEFNYLAHAGKQQGKNIKNYWSNEHASDCNDTILVDLLIDHVGTNHNNLLLAKSVQLAKGGGNLVGLIDYPTRWRIKNFGLLFGQLNYVSIWRVFNFKPLLEALIESIRLRRSLVYDSAFGIRVNVDGQELGDLIYDQYLRETFYPTVRKVDFRYRLFIFKMLFLYYRYKELIESGGYSDIILSHKVYGLFGLIGRAAASCGRSVRLWQWYGGKPISITCCEALQSSIQMPRAFNLPELERLISHFSQTEIEAEFESLAALRFSASDENQIDLEFVYKNIEIKNYQEFEDEFQPRDEIIFIFSHAFVDSVKYTDWQVYSDHYTWLEMTLIMLANDSTNASIFVKAHPSEELYPCSETVSGLVHRINLEYCAEFIYLDRKIHNFIVFDHADLIITSSGTIAMEAPCFGKRVITCAKTLFDGAGACKQAKCHDEYKQLLEDWRSLPCLSGVEVLYAKACFLWVSKYVYTTASFLTLTDYRGDADYASQLRIVDEGYFKATFAATEPLFQEVKALLKGGKQHSDCLPRNILCAE